jgi:hypothetical protein
MLIFPKINECICCESMKRKEQQQLGNALSTQASVNLTSNHQLDCDLIRNIQKTN